MVYVVKLLVFYVIGGALIATVTSGLHPLDASGWWEDPIVYQKLVLWTLLLESSLRAVSSTVMRSTSPGA